MQAASTQIQQNPPPAARPGRKRKTPPAEPEPNPLQHMIHPMSAIPPGYQYSADFTPGGLPPQDAAAASSQEPQPPSPEPTTPTSGGRALSSSKRAEQNRKAQRAFRERRDQHVKQLESRSQLLDAALASADEANRRWEECRVLVDQLRIENAALRAALTQQATLLPPGAMNNHTTHMKEPGATNAPDEHQPVEGLKEQSQ
ncbi:hypothetical protein GGX14DRAFT_439932 [Mycena pura]|uniref:BZIP domain-containing protein n=1 Tax=Mycena pura TaxID=153505 RepID=A0AAD6YG94_9AGAR|nr:hypothetical protein GGX14DRAFT_439932 [Mycena pura]